MRREAAVVLCGHDIGRGPQEWEKILGRAMISFASLKDDDTDSKLFKSLKFLISRAILANPKGAAATAIAYCELKSKDGEIPLHVVKELEVWAAKYTREGDAMEWHQILAALGLPNQPDIKQPRPGAATIDFQKPSHYGDPISVMELNVNGLAARWKQHEIDVPLQEVQLDDHDSSAVSPSISLSKMAKMEIMRRQRAEKKRKRKESELAKGDFRKTVAETGRADCLVLLETKMISRSCLHCLIL